VSVKESAGFATMPTRYEAMANDQERTGSEHRQYAIKAQAEFDRRAVRKSPPGGGMFGFGRGSAARGIVATELPNVSADLVAFVRSKPSIPDCVSVTGCLVYSMWRSCKLPFEV
jgi:hypothetical protein